MVGMSETADELIERWGVDRAYQIRFGDDSFANSDYHALGWLIRHAWEAGYSFACAEADKDKSLDRE